MARETNTLEWRFEAMTVLDRVTMAERRFSMSTSVNKITVLAAADELQAATTGATMWLKGNPCPDAELRGYVAWMLKTCADVARAAHQAVADPTVNTRAAMDRLNYLLTVFDFDSARLDAGLG
jgi:hypothetical protein